MTKFYKGQLAWNKKDKITISCVLCKAKFYDCPSSTKKYCSKKCYWESRIGTKRKSRQVEVNCEYCKKTFFINNGRTLCFECHKLTPTYLNGVYLKAYAK